MEHNVEIGAIKVVNSLGWKMIERFFSQGVNLIIQIVLARMLMPSDFGVVAIIFAITNYAGLFVQSGLSTAIVQKKEIEDKDINTIFTSSFVVAILLYILLFLISPYLSRSYNMPYILWPLRVSAIVLLLYAVNSVQMALLTRNMEFRKIFLRSIIAVPVSGVLGIILAYLGLGIWALVFHTISNITITVIVMSLATGYKPRFEFYWSRAKNLYSFSVMILMSSLISGFGDTLRTLIIGKRYDENHLAYYDKALSYSSYFTQIINSSISSVLLPTFSRKQEDRLKVRDMARRSVQLTAFVVIPFLVLIMSIAEPFVSLLLTEKWMPCVPFLVLFCVFRMPGSVTTIDKQVYYALGNSKISFVYEFCLLLANIIMLLITVPISVYAIAVGATIVEIVGNLVLMIISSKFFNYTILMRFKDVIRPILISTGMFVVLSFDLFVFSSEMVTILVKVAIGVTMYLGIGIFLRDHNLIYIYQLARQYKRANYNIKNRKYD